MKSRVAANLLIQFTLVIYAVGDSEIHSEALAFKLCVFTGFFDMQMMSRPLMGEL